MAGAVWAAMVPVSQTVANMDFSDPANPATVFLPPGRYSIGATIELPNAAILMGAGAYATHLVANATAKPHAMSEPSSLCNCRG